MAYDYHYDSQQRRFLEQIVRGFSGFQYMTGPRPDANGVMQDGILQVVPCRMALQNRQVGQIMNNNSENVLLAVPLITVWQSGLRFDRERLQQPNFVSTLQVVERDIDKATGKYGSERGNSYTVQRMMPVPFEMAIQVDIWTSNLDQKHQLAEQILTTFSNGFDIQNSDNALDWSALTTIYLDDIVWSSVTVPVGTDSQIDIMTLNFKLPIWLNPPAKVKQQKIITEIIDNMYDGDDPRTNGHGIFVDGFPGTTLLSRDVITPDNHQIQVDGGNVKLLGADGSETDANGQAFSWATFIDQYGILRPALSQLHLRTTNNLDSSVGDIVGTIQFDSGDPSLLLWQIDPDTLPTNTLSPINAVIDPRRSYPGTGLPAAAVGQRYLLSASIGGTTVAWGNLSAADNDIIEFQSGAWARVFQASTTTSAYVLNTFTGKQLRWTGTQWQMAIDGEYFPGYWVLRL